MTVRRRAILLDEGANGVLQSIHAGRPRGDPTFGGCYVTVKRTTLQLSGSTSTSAAPTLSPTPEFPRHFDARSTEAYWIDRWGDNALPDTRQRFALTGLNPAPRPWFLPMPPPNITGQLHLGHALFLALQDAKTRFHAQIGNDALWLPGTDHAGLATHAKILETLGEQGLDPTDRRTYLREAWAWKDRFHARITGQIRRMGAACDWSQERFTLDEGSQRSAIAALERCHAAGMLYRENGEWYLRMDALARELLEALDAGEIRITPDSNANQLRHFLRTIEPWCLSRDIPWGLPLPIETRGDAWRLSPTPTMLRRDDPTFPADDGGWTRETRTFDTWFLSALWPFSSLGWPEQTPALERYYPAAWMETADDILFFWCARMLMMGKLLTGTWPFREIYLHGLIRDSQGRKMSKSLGNGIDPLELIDRYGADALRWMLIGNAQPGLDMRFNPATLAGDAKFLNKIWQAGRFLAMQGLPEAGATADGPPDPTFDAELDALTAQWAGHLQADGFALAARALQQHFREAFCDRWLEAAKPALRAGDADRLRIARRHFRRYLALFHPFLPFLTLDLYERLGLAPAMR